MKGTYDITRYNKIIVRCFLLGFFIEISSPKKNKLQPGMNEKDTY